MIGTRCAILLIEGAGPALARAPARGTYVARLEWDTWSAVVDLTLEPEQP